MAHRSGRPEILEAFGKTGVRCTPQRYAILEYLTRAKNHPTAEQIFRSVNRSHPQASLATIYKSLDAMLRAGLVREVRLGHAVRFESRTERHHHFVCDRCGRVEDLDWFEMPPLSRTVLGRRSVREFQIILRGACGECR
jgi:Fur family peroxide stress response transcriptional regulator